MNVNSYLKILQATSKVWGDISPTERTILEAVIRNVSPPLLRVQDILAMREIASQATIHKSLSSLVSKGYLALKPDPTDGRAKFVTLGKKTHVLVEKLSKHLSDSI